MTGFGDRTSAMHAGFIPEAFYRVDAAGGWLAAVFLLCVGTEPRCQKKSPLRGHILAREVFC